MAHYARIEYFPPLLIDYAPFYGRKKQNRVRGLPQCFMVEGHTDNVPYSNAVLLDNWDLRAKRATSVVRILKNQYGQIPSKLAASGRGEYNPVVDNSTPENRAINCRTRIVILPQLDQFFWLLEPKK